MSSISLNRLIGQRQYKAGFRENLQSDFLIENLPADWLSDRYLTRSDIIDKFEKVHHCADHLEAVDGGSDENGGPVLNVLRANWCKCHAICPICSARLQGRRRVRYEQPIKGAARRFPHRYMLTFTVADGGNLVERLNHLRDGFRRWYRMGQRRADGRRSGGESSKIGAMLTGVEIKKTAAGLWHVHLHALAFADAALDYRIYDRGGSRFGSRLSDDKMREMVREWSRVGGVDVPVSKLSGEWLRATGDSVNLDCRPIRGGAYEIDQSALEVLKYSTKLNPVETTNKMDFVELLAGTFGRRLFAALREFRGVAGDDFDAPGEAEYVLNWDYVTGEYVPVSSVKRADLRAAVLGVVGSMVGRWRRDRRELVAEGNKGRDLAARLDEMKRSYRAAIKTIWRSASLDSLRESLKKTYPAPAVVPQWIQASLFDGALLSHNAP